MDDLLQYGNVCSACGKWIDTFDHWCPQMQILDKPHKATGYALEKKIAKQGGGKRTPGSGNGVVKEDITEGNWLIQCKETNKRSISIKLDDLFKLEINALQRGKVPRFEFELFDGAEGHGFVVLSKKVFERVRDALD